MSWYFDQTRATQAAAFVVKCSGSKRMAYLKLLKLLYFADRESLRENGYPITGDQAFAMKRGPVLSTIYDCITSDQFVEHDIWDRFFCTVGFDVQLKEDPGTGKLSRCDKRTLKNIYEIHKDLDGFDLSELSHLLPEFVTTNEARIRRNHGSEIIPIQETLRALGFSPEEIADIQERMEDERCYFQFFEDNTSALNSSAR